MKTIGFRGTQHFQTNPYGYEASKPRPRCDAQRQEKTHRQKWTFEHMVEEAEAVFTFIGPSRYTETGDHYIGDYGDCRSASDSRDFGRK